MKTTFSNIHSTLILGAYGTGNVGDEAILEGIIEIVKKSNPTTNLCVLSFDPQETNRIHNVAAIKATLLSMNTYRSLLRSQRLIIGGGQLIASYWGAYFCLWGLIAKLFGKEVEFYAIGVEKISHLATRILIPIVMNIVDMISVRDVISQQYLISAGVKKPIKLSDYPAQSLKPITSKIAKELLDKEGISRKETLLGLTLRYTQDRALNMILKKEILEVIEWFLNTYSSSEVIFIPMCKHRTAWFEQDQNLAFELQKLVSKKKRFHILKRKYTPRQVKGLIGQLDCLLAMRLHSLIFAQSMKVPLIGIAYGDKIRGFLKPLGKKIIEPSSINAEEMKRFIHNSLQCSYRTPLKDRKH